MANKPKIKKKERMVKKKGKRERKLTTTLPEKKEEVSNVSEQCNKGWIHVIHEHDTTHLAVTTTRQAKDAYELPHTEKE